MPSLTLRGAAVMIVALAVVLVFAGSTPPTPAQAAISELRINEIESSGGTPGDWVEIYNSGATAVDVSGLKFLDNDNTHTAYAIPAGTTIAAGAYLVLEEAQFVFGLGQPDTARLLQADGVTVIDSHAWTTHATTTLGRCPNGTGAFATTASATKGLANTCGAPPPETVSAETWPGGPDVAVADGLDVLGGNMSGLAYEPSATAAPGVLWAVKNGPGTLYRLLWNGSIWAPDTANGWSAGKPLRYPGGTGDPDAEGVTFAGTSPAGGIYVATERNNAANTVSRLSVLRFEVGGTTSDPLTATHEWELTAGLPAVGPNLGLEAITWVPDSFLVARGFFDEARGHAYLPAEYANHGTGLFFVGVEAGGQVHAYALDHVSGASARVASIASGHTGVMGLEFEATQARLWAVCDDTCQGRSTTLQVNAAGRFVVTHLFDRPAGMPNINNEGFAIGAQAECIGNRKPAFWADDANTDGHAIRRGTVACTEDSDLTVTKELKPGQPTPTAGGRLYYLVRVKNVAAVASPKPPTTVTMVDTPPAGTNVLAWTVISGSGKCSLNGASQLVCDLGASMAPGAETIVEVVIRTPRSGSLTNTAEVDPFRRIAEFNETNNMATLATMVP